MLEQYEGQIRFVYRDFPVVGGEAAAFASECADEQGEYWTYHDALFDDPNAFTSMDVFVSTAEELGLDAEAFEACLESDEIREEIINDYNDGRAYGVTGTPTFFVNGVRLVGAQPLSAFQSVIDEELEAAQ